MQIERTNNIEDDLLVNAIKGNQRALADLVKAHSAIAYTIAFRIVLNKEDAEEVVQDALLKAFSSLGQFKRSAKFSTWLYRIVHNAALDKVRSRKSVSTHRKGLSHQYMPYHGNTGWTRLVDQDKKTYLDRALECLSEIDRSLFALHYTAERPIAEISKITGLKRSAIKMRLSRGRVRLKRELERLLGNDKNTIL